MTPIEKRTILINTDIELKHIADIDELEKEFNRRIRAKGITEKYAFEISRNRWKIIS